MNASPEVATAHCQYSALVFLKDHFPKERVAALEQYLKNEKMMNMKARKRYMKVPSGKRQRYDDQLNTEYAVPIQTELLHADNLMPMI